MILCKDPLYFEKCHKLSSDISKEAHQGYNQPVPHQIFETFCYRMTKMCSDFLAGKKNQYHVTVALTSWAPFDISKNTLEIHSIKRHDLKVDI